MEVDEGAAEEDGSEKGVALETSQLPAAARRRPAAPRQCSSLCTPGSTPAGGGTGAGRSARRTSSPWAWRTSDL